MTGFNANFKNQEFFNKKTIYKHITRVVVLAFKIIEIKLIKYKNENILGGFWEILMCAGSHAVEADGTRV